MQYLAQGSQAPDFTLLNQDEKSVNLAETLKDHQVLVYFYPKALTPGCTTQACSLRDTKAELLEKHNTVVFGLSPDEPKKLRRFQEKHDLNFDLLSDIDHKVADDFGVWGLKKFMGKEYDGIHRISFLVNQQGVVEKVFDKFKTKDHHQVVLDFLNENA
ncbi:thioredoxin-dependent thiol peroxidase [Catenovulum agarivorans DS-2]|uniref:thioredoxin-dependent peroxiredoxin n=1 Tax=Catenovulum agarivorans DS-2 TaxID=1328313 RepID=W7R0D1_9ALTE|nr:thioredoxin-dependent thiol peroxidase [Catenovulum agarivorans]EWH11065.1 thioredoxin-dependent thiol peroxidase [Catenovulum agarivorans DS-2]